MKTIYQSRDFHPDKVFARYAAYGLTVCKPPYDQRGFMIHDVNVKGQTIRTTIVAETDLPAKIAAQCRALDGQAFNQVKLS